MTGLIILEGPDGSGKTTLARYLEEKFGAAYFHQSYSKDWNIFDYFTERLREAVRLSASQLVVMDRLWASELVYGTVYRGGSKWPQCGRMIDRVVQKHAGLYVFCLGDPQIIAQRHAELKQTRSEMFSDGAEKVAKAYLDFALAATATGLKPQLARPDAALYRIEAEGKDLGAFAHKLEERMQLWRSHQFQPALDPDNQNVLGHLASADMLFVGDKTNPKVVGLNWPFYEYGNCSLYLAEALDALGWSETRGMWTNASDPEEHLGALLAAKKWRSVVALGTNAADRLDGFGAQFSLVDHPQYHRRFCGDLQAYAAMLRQVLGMNGT